MQYAAGGRIEIGTFKEFTLPAVTCAVAVFIPVLKDDHGLGRTGVKRQVVRKAVQRIDRVLRGGFTGQGLGHVGAGLFQTEASGHNRRGRGCQNGQQSHCGQQTAADVPFVFHPLRVADSR